MQDTPTEQISSSQKETKLVVKTPLLQGHQLTMPLNFLINLLTALNKYSRYIGITVLRR